MKRKILAIGLFAMAQLGVNRLTAQTNFQQKYLVDDSYIFNDVTKIREQEVFTTYKPEFSLNEEEEMVPTNNFVEKDGTFRTKYELYNNGVPVEGSAMNVMGNKGIVGIITGKIVTGISVNKDAIIGMDAAINNAIQYVGATKYLWEDSTIEAELKEDGDPNATNYPQYAGLIIAKNRGEGIENTPGNYQLCYKVNIQSMVPFGNTDVYVNANTGQIFTSQTALEADYSSNGTLWTWYNGYRTDLRARSCGLCLNFWLHDVDRNIFTTTHGKSYFKKGFYNEDNNNNWVENGTKTAASAEWALQRAWDYYFNRHGRWGTDYQGKRVHIQTALQNATSRNAYYSNADANLNDNGQDNIYITADGLGGAAVSTPGYSMAALDVLAHEYTHGMIKRSSALGLFGDFDAKALNEGFADIFGARIEGYVMGSMDWNVGGSLGFTTRFFDNPHQDFPTMSASKYLEPGYWQTNVNYPHMNGGVMRKWFHLLANGGTFNNRTVQGLGIETTDNIAYIVFNWWLWSNVNFPQAANQIVAEVKTDFGNCSNIHKQTVKALQAVGFTVPTPFCSKFGIDGIHVLEIAPSYVNPFTINFNDLTDKGGRVTWILPRTWHGTYSNSNRTFTLNSVDNYQSQVLKAIYQDSVGNSSQDSIVVHFSDVPWTPTEMPVISTMSSRAENKMNLSANTGIEVYPNPAAQDVTINLISGTREGQVEVYNISGTLVYSGKFEDATKTISLNGFSNGIYLVKVKTNDNVYSQKLTVVK